MNKERSDRNHEIDAKANLLGNQKVLLDVPLGQKELNRLLILHYYAHN